MRRILILLELVSCSLMTRKKYDRLTRTAKKRIVRFECEKGENERTNELDEVSRQFPSLIRLPPSFPTDSSIRSRASVKEPRREGKKE